MGMTITVAVADGPAAEAAIEAVFSYFNYIDATFSTYKDTSEISKINRGEIQAKDYSQDMRTVFELAEQTKRETDGYFNIVTPRGTYDPSGLVKGWAIHNASKILHERGIHNFYVDAGGDVQADGRDWKIGIKNPFDQTKIVKVVQIKDMGLATSGTYIRGQHIYNPHQPGQSITDIVSLTVIGPNVYEADRFATAAFAMGKGGIFFLERLSGFAAYLIDAQGMATMTRGFEAYII